MDLHFNSAVVFVPERHLVLFSVLCDGRHVRCALGNAVLALLEGRPVESEDEQAAAFERCRGRTVAIVRRVLEQGRGAGAGCISRPRIWQRARMWRRWLVARAEGQRLAPAVGARQLRAWTRGGALSPCGLAPGAL
jgi:hypothetical protein